MSELMAGPNGHLQVINVICGCQLTSHLNNHSLWNTNQTVSPWCAGHSVPLIWGFMRGQRQQKWGGQHRSGFSLHQMRPSNLQILVTLVPLRHMEPAASWIMRSQYFCHPDRCVFTALMCWRKGPNECDVGDLSDQPRFICCVWVQQTAASLSAMCSAAQALKGFNDASLCHLMVIVSLKITL